MKPVPFGESRRTRAVLSLAIAALSTTGLPVAAEDDATVALIPVVREGAEAAPVVPLLEAELASRGGFRLVERERIDAVLNEVVLQSAIGEEGLSARRRLALLLRADLLVTLAQQPAEDLTELRLSVAESKLGLRLAAAGFVWDADGADAVVKDMADAAPSPSLFPRWS